MISSQICRNRKKHVLLGWSEKTMNAGNGHQNGLKLRANHLDIESCLLVEHVFFPLAAFDQGGWSDVLLLSGVSDVWTR